MITLKTAVEIASHEVVIRQAYKDSVGVWTWGVGITNASGHNVERYIDNPQPMQKCIEVFQWALERYADDVREVLGDDLTEEQFAAALSFHWNTGGIKRASWVDHFNAGNIDAAKKAFMAWRKPPEIIPRRQCECDLFFDGVWSNKGTVPEYTRLKSNYTPDWSSRVERDVSDFVDEPPRKKRKGLWAAILALLWVFKR